MGFPMMPRLELNPAGQFPRACVQGKVSKPPPPHAPPPPHPGRRGPPPHLAPPPPLRDWSGHSHFPWGSSASLPGRRAFECVHVSSGVIFVSSSIFLFSFLEGEQCFGDTFFRIIEA